MKVVRILSLICFFTISLLAQITTGVTGFLEENGKRLAGEKVKLVSATQTFETTTDGAGAYIFKDIADGKYLLVYSDRRASVTVKSGQVTTTALGDVVVISAGESQTIEE